MHVVDQSIEASAVTRETSSHALTGEERVALRKVRVHAESGRWRELIATISALGLSRNHPKLLIERTRAALELNDDAEVTICTNSSLILEDNNQKVNLASILVNGNRPREAARILSSLPAGSPSPRAVKVARRILAATQDGSMRAEVREFIGSAVRQPLGPEPIIHRYPGDNDDFVLPPNMLSIVRLPGVASEIEARVQDIWTRFDITLQNKPFPFLREYENVFVNEKGQVWTPAGDPIRSCGLALPEGIDPKSVPNLDAAFSCVRENKGYYEWVVDRLATLSWRLGPTGPDCPILVRKEQRDLAVNALVPLGIDEDKILSVVGTIFCHRLYLGISTAGAMARISAYQYTYGRLIEAAAKEDRGDTPKRFYISRLDSNRRSLANQLDFEAVMAKRGYVPVILSKLGLIEKINLFRNADVVIGAHGAGFSHLIFAKPGLRVIELMPVTMNQFSQMGYRVCFSLLSRVYSLNHTMVLHPMNPVTSVWSADPDFIADLV